MRASPPSDPLQGPAGLQSLFPMRHFVVSEDTADSLCPVQPLPAVSSQRLISLFPSHSLGARGGELPPGPGVAGWGFAVTRASTPSKTQAGVKVFLCLSGPRSPSPQLLEVSVLFPEAHD